MVYTNKNGAATLVAENNRADYATEVASPKRVQSGAMTLVIEDYATEVASPKKVQSGAMTLVVEDNATEVASPKRGAEV